MSCWAICCWANFVGRKQKSPWSVGRAKYLSVVHPFWCTPFGLNICLPGALGPPLEVGPAPGQHKVSGGSTAFPSEANVYPGMW